MGRIWRSRDIPYLKFVLAVQSLISYTAPMKINYVTSNQGKFQEAQHILKDWQLQQVNIDLPELQGTRQEIIQAKAKTALERLHSPLIVEDVSTYLHALNGLPGPYIKEFLKKLGPIGIADLVHRYEDHTCLVICTVAYIQPGAEPICFEGIVEGTVVKPRGDYLFHPLSWNQIFLPKGSQRTYGELSLEELSRLSMRLLALTQLREYLEKDEQR